MILVMAPSRLMAADWARAEGLGPLEWRHVTRAQDLLGYRAQLHLIPYRLNSGYVGFPDDLVDQVRFRLKLGDLKLYVRRSG